MSSENKNHRIFKNGREYWVTEEVYKAYMQSQWREEKRLQREKRCRIAKGIRCNQDCSKCDKIRTGSPVSLDVLNEKEICVQDYSADVEEIVIFNIEFEKIMRIVMQLSPDDQMIVKMISYGLSDREMASYLGVTQSTLNYRKNRVLKTIRNRYK